MPVHSDAEIETAVATLGAEQAGLVEYSSFLAVHVGTVISSTARYRVPAIYENPLFASKGGLIAYGASFMDMFRRAAGYVDRILRGEKPNDLPVRGQELFSAAGRGVGIEHERGSFDARRDLFQQTEPLAAGGGLDVCKSRNVATRVCQARD
jgi:hypothetical protein